MAVPAQTTSACDSRLDRVSVIWTLALVGGLMLVGIIAAIKAIHKPFWFDEIFTLIIAKMQSPAEMIQALKVPIDIMPPPYYMICSAALRFAPNEHIGLRLPSLCGYLMTVACVYVFLSPRVDRMSALAGAAFVTCTALSDYAYEARPYALMTGSICCAACAWQRIDRSWAWAVALALSLGLAVSCHYYAVFAWPAFGLAEMLVLVCERRFRARAWLALAIGLVPFIVCWPLLANFRNVFGKTWWSAPRLGLIARSPMVLFKWAGGMWGPATTAVLAVFCMGWVVRALPIALSASFKWFPRGPLKLGESGLALGLLGIPVIAVAAAYVAQGGMTDRYMMPAIVGAALSIGALTSTFRPTFRAAALSIILLNCGLAELQSLWHYATGRTLDAQDAISRPCETFITSLGDDSPPVVIADGLVYMQLALYCDPETRSRILAIADPAAVTASGSSDVVDRTLLLVRPYFPVHVTEYDDLIAQHGSFLLRVNGNTGEWLPKKLLEDGHAVALVSHADWGTIFRVTVTKP